MGMKESATVLYITLCLPVYKVDIIKISTMIWRVIKMGCKDHFVLSLWKSIIRIAGCIACLFTKDILILALFFLFAEALGIVEELVDKRK